MSKIFKIYPFILFLVFSSCSTPYRIVSSVGDEANCKEIATNIIRKSSAVAANIENSDELPFTQIMRKRDLLREKYQKVVESIKDFNPTLDRGIDGSAKILIDPKEAYLAKLMMIKRAKYSIDVSYYIFQNDESGQALLHELRMAIKRGVKVRLMVDSLGSMASAPFRNEIKALSVLRGGVVRDLKGQLTNERAKADIVVINPMFNIRAHVSNWYKRTRNLFLSKEDKLPLTTFSMNRRSHDKILMIDAYSPEDSMAIVGGRNVANYYYDLGETKNKTFQDLEILVKNIARVDDQGDTHNALENYYNKLFYYMANKNLENFIIGINRDGVKKEFYKMRDGRDAILKGMKLEEEMRKMEEQKFLDNDFEEGMLSIVHELQNFSREKAFLNPLGAHNLANGNSLVAKLHTEMKTAKKSISIVSPYLWLSDEDITFLKKWLAEDSTRELKIISNSLSTTDNIPAQAMVDTILGPKLVVEVEGTNIAKQVKVFAYGKLDDIALGGTKNYGKLHAKFAIIDDKLLIGTSNLDPRSRYLNSELGVFFEGKNGVQINELRKYFNSLADMSYIWGSKEWSAVRTHKNNRIALALQSFAGKIIHYFNLIPLI